MTTKIQMDHEMADLALFKFKEIAESIGLDWCLYAGTVLGLHRDGKYLPGDNDLDFAIKPKFSQLELLWSALDDAGFKLGRTNENADGSQNRHTYFHPEVRHPDEGGLLVDIFFRHTEDEDNFMSWYDGIWYKDELWLTPHPLNFYLQYAYGDWQDKTLRNSAAGKEYAKTL